MTIACPDCGTLQQLPRLDRGDVAVCSRCEARLERVNARSVSASLACALTTWLLLFPANLLTLFSLRIFGISVQTQIGSGVFALAGKGWILLAVLIGASALVLPFLRYGLLVVALGCVQLRYRPRWLGPVFRWAILLDRWTMPEVFLIACAVGYARIAAQASIVYVGAGGYCFVGVALMAMLSRALLDRRTVWRAIAPERAVPPGTAVLSCTICDLVLPLSEEGKDCPRCRLKLRARWPGSWTRTLALVIAALLLYIPANVFPMSVTHYPGRVQSYRIVDGVMALFGAGLWPLGVLVSCTSIGIPVVKLAGLAWCLLSVRRRSDKHLRLKTQLYRMIDEAGRWSSVDPFIIAVIVPLMHLRSFVSTDAGAGATAFIAVVALTMTASRGFDPRLMWDAALERRHARG
ncbi:MAG TPA: paraquat-inducible protein A [Steroidobacteraceae bacterium]|jgi:paraquat-inducible protein A|nr:paraquat-inducible protein A [Steroidobacteraceae bacterium]